MCADNEECVIAKLLLNSFSSIQDSSIKREIVQAGRPTPDLPGLTFNNGTKNRYFNKTCYDVHPWITGCARISKLFCWPCILMSTERSVWNLSGYGDLNNLTNATKRHSSSQSHMRACLDVHNFSKSRIDFLCDDQPRSDILNHNEKVKKNREVLKSLINIVCLLGKQELCFRGHDETESSLNRGNYVEFAMFLKDYDANLSEHFNTSSVFNGLSKHIQNDLIEAIGCVIVNEINNEINGTKFVSILLDETSDFANMSQISTVFRYCNINGEVVERFVGFTNVSAEKKASSLLAHVDNQLDRFHCGKKLIGQGYDGAAVMAGHLSGLQAKVKEKYPLALFVYCSAHQLDLVLMQALKQINSCRIFFLTLNEHAAFFNSSAKRTHLLDNVVTVVHKHSPHVSSVCWSVQFRVVNTTHEYRESLIEVFEIIRNNPDEWDDESVMKCRGLHQNLNDFNFLFQLEIHNTIFAHTDIMFDVLQKRGGNDITQCVLMVESAITFMEDQKTKFEEVYEHVIQLVGEPPHTRRKNFDVQQYYKQVYGEIFDLLITQLRTRFASLKDIKFQELLVSEKFKNYVIHFPSECLNSLQVNYGEHFDLTKLRSELSVIYNSQDFREKTVQTIFQYLSTDLMSTFEETHKLCSLVLTLPSTTVSVESSFSALTRIKDHKRNSMKNDSLTGLALMAIEKHLLNTIRSRGNFYDLVIEEFVKKERELDFTYK